MKKNDIDKKTKAKAILKIAILIAILVALPLYIFIYNYDVIKTFSNVKSIEQLVFAHKGYGFLILLGSQVLQILVSIIPGQPIQFACGYIFSPIIALLISIAGSMIGSSIAFFLARYLGRESVEVLIGDNKAMQYLDKLDSRNGYFLLFALTFIPGFPKDPLCYIAGLSEMKFLPFIVIVTTARIPGMLGSLLIGHYSYMRNYKLIAIVAVIVIVLSILGLKYKDKILEWGDKVYNKLNRI